MGTLYVGTDIIQSVIIYNGIILKNKSIIIIKVMPKAFIVHNFIKFQGWTETNLNLQYPVRTPFPLTTF